MQEQKYQLRLLTEDDVSEFRTQRLRALDEDADAFGSTVNEFAELSLEELARRLKSSDDSFVLGAFMPSLVGMVGFFRHNGLKRRHISTIWGMYVAPEARGIGLGRALMKDAIERAIQLPDIEQIALTVTAYNVAAIDLYKSLGFKSYGFERQALKTGDRYLDEEMMVLFLRD